tara:strand:- start:4949 stop:6064 length:1116 start_codon:yes stop_codon:yes gene_type:complete
MYLLDLPSDIHEHIATFLINCLPYKCTDVLRHTQSDNRKKLHNCKISLKIVNNVFKDIIDNYGCYYKKGIISLQRRYASSMAFSPCGKYIAISEGNYGIRILDINSGREMKTFDTCNNSVIVTVAWYKQYLIGSGHRWAEYGANTHCLYIYIWNVNTGQLMRILKDISIGINWIECNEFSPCGNYIAAGGGDTCVRLWKISNVSNDVYQIYKVHSNTVRSIAFSPNGTRIVSGGVDYKVCVWDISQGMLIWTKEHNKIVNSVAWNGNYIVSGGDDYCACLWDGNTGEKRNFTESNMRVTAVVFSLDGKCVVLSGFKKCQLRIWSIIDNKVYKIKVPNCDSNILYVTSLAWFNENIVIGDNLGKIHLIKYHT